MKGKTQLSITGVLSISQPIPQSCWFKSRATMDFKGVAFKEPDPNCFG